MNKINSDLQKKFSSAEKLFSEGLYKESISQYEKILIDFPNLIGAINNIGLAYEYLNKLDISLKYYKKCSSLNPNEKIFINNIANIHYKKKDYSNSMKELDKSLSIDDNQIKIIERKAECLINSNLRKEANSFFQIFVKKFPNNNFLNTLHGKNLISLNNHKEGLEYLKKGTGFIELSNKAINIV